MNAFDSYGEPTGELDEGPVNVGGKSLGDLSVPPLRVWCPITTEDCTQGCVNECVSGTLRTPAPKVREDLPYTLSTNDYGLLVEAARTLGAVSGKLSHWDGTYRHGLCSERCEQAAQAIRHALSGLDIFLGDEGAAAVLAPRKETR